ncbi:hypothetical protein KSB_68610 [Ktedonobacter robiniae]|uniref:Uncharacterized protein n=1 Tax=Ktedonobacter robiniae TaxID=2778365 RepID=A0ABQ3UZS1_9CHLR|nr:hypothetical protein KSB_68610 [Ktedonobacter robiniae]
MGVFVTCGSGHRVTERVEQCLLREHTIWTRKTFFHLTHFATQEGHAPCIAKQALALRERRLMAQGASSMYVQEGQDRRSILLSKAVE